MLRGRLTAELKRLSRSRLERSTCSLSEGETEVVIALGGNQGDRAALLEVAIRELGPAGIAVSRFSSLYESAAAYVTDQPAFLNAAVLAHTSLAPTALLAALKSIEGRLGRVQGGLRYGPRPIDLDVIFYGGAEIRTENLEIPHPRIRERPFVLAPLADLAAAESAAGSSAESAAGANRGGGLRQAEGSAGAHNKRVAGRLRDAMAAWTACGGEAGVSGAGAGAGNDGGSGGGGGSGVGGGGGVGGDGLRRVVPLPSRRLLRLGGRTMIMGILNVTPDSFSDGGVHTSIDAALRAAEAMAAEGADIIDVGGQSTRPGAVRLSASEELERVGDLLLRLRGALGTDSAGDGGGGGGGDGPLLSVDTFHSEVAAAAAAAGAHIINDVSGGCLDAAMHGIVGASGCAFVMNHMRGEPGSMQQDRYTRYGDVVSEVAAELAAMAAAARRGGVPAWRLVADPGLGFSKRADSNWELIRRLHELRPLLARSGALPPFAPLLLGPSRKGFLGAATGRAAGPPRDAATAACVAACVAGGADIVRVHNVPAGRDAARVADSVWRRRRSVD